jgi:predicted glycoside hydrolase/deacetylase ChbG (UPF0249 family)
MSECVNFGILDSHLRGIVANTTIFANGAAFGGAVAISKQYAHTRVLTMPDKKLLSALLRNVPEGINELMRHPGRLDPILNPKMARHRESRQREFDALISPESANLVVPLGIKLISFPELRTV